MTYNKAVNKAIEICVGQDENNGLFYVEPLYRMIFKSEGLVAEYVDETEAADLPSREELFEILQLYVQKMNAKTDNARALIDWIYTIAITNIDHASTLEENELMKNLLEYMKMKDTVADKEKELEAREDRIEEKEAKEKYENVLPFGVNIAKKKD